MPERADVSLIHRFSNNACAIVDFVTERAYPKLQYAKSDRDQPTRGSTFDLQGLREGFCRVTAPPISARVGQADLIENAPDYRIYDSCDGIWPAIERRNGGQQNRPRLEQCHGVARVN